MGHSYTVIWIGNVDYAVMFQFYMNGAALDSYFLPIFRTQSLKIAFVMSRMKRESGVGRSQAHRGGSYRPYVLRPRSFPFIQTSFQASRVVRRVDRGREGVCRVGA